LKRVAILGAVVVLLGCSAATVADDHKSLSTNKYKPVYEVNAMSQIIETHKRQTMLEQQAAEALKNIAEQQKAHKERVANRQALEDRIVQLETYVGKTWYVFSGSSPSGWDCSGLTRWFYEGLDITLDHSASKQAKNAGYYVDTPQIGDIVGFKHLNSKKYFHVGIYAGNGMVIHSKKPGTRTEKIKLTDGWFAQSEISFIRVLDN
jgi:cell wall-associated NlpC family hydrolase